MFMFRIKFLCLCRNVFFCIFIHHCSFLQAQISAPTALSGLRLWVDATDINGNGTNPSNGAQISQWTDKSGIGNHLMASGAFQPSYEVAGFGVGLPAVRFTTGKELSGPNLFGSTIYQSAVTIFFVHANVTLENNFMINMNGDNSGITQDDRFSFHMPWSDGNYYFDAGGCCGLTRLTNIYPNLLTQITQVSAVNSVNPISGFTTERQLIRFDGMSSMQDATAIAPRVSGGMRIGTTSGHNYNGRFAEIIVYDRALSLTEIQSVECYLLTKWKPTVAAGCLPTVTAQKSSMIYDTGSNPLYRIPGNDIIYKISIRRTTGQAVSNNSIFVLDSVPTNLIFYNGDYDGAGPGNTPVGFVDNGSGLIFTYATDVKYSNAVVSPTSFAACTYAPIAAYDVNVKHICVNPKGSFVSGLAGSSFDLFFRAQIK
jgi:hypothetical protein